MVNNVVHVQEMVKYINADIPILTDDKEETIEEVVSYLDEYSSIANETSVDNKCINITPSEGKQPKSILNYQFCEQLPLLYLFPAGKFGKL